MQQFQVPQFITIEDRIIGPLTLKQFFYLLGAASIGLLGWRFLYFPLFVVLIVPLAAFFVAMALAKIDERPFPAIFMAAISYFLKPRLYLWRHTAEKKKEAKTAPPLPTEESPLVHLSKLSESRLNDLAWSLDIKERIGDRG